MCDVANVMKSSMLLLRIFLRVHKLFMEMDVAMCDYKRLWSEKTGELNTYARQRWRRGDRAL